jgi:DNA modification methylase
MSNTNPTIEMLPTAGLVPYARNSRTHSPEQVAQIAGSIREFGFTNPVLVDAENGIIAGHGRIMAAQKLGLERVPCIRLGYLTESQKRAYIIADNKLALNAGWDFEMLKVEVMELQADDFDVSLLGFDDLEMADLLADPTEGETDADDVPDVPPDPVTVLGDVWVMGKHRLMCGDSTSIDAVEKLMAGSKADMVFTDPPYGVDYDGGHAVKGKRREKLANDATADIYSDVLPMAYAASKDSASLYLWFSDSKSAAVTAAVTAAGYEVRNTLIWNKNMAQFGAIGAQYKSKHEPCLYCFKSGSPPFWQGPNNEVSVWDVKRESKNEFHPTQKPTELAERAFANSCPPAGVVLDLFGGSGSTLVACEKTGRVSRTMELSQPYCDVIITRWQAFTGKQAIHEATGKTFDEMKAAKPAA